MKIIKSLGLKVIATTILGFSLIGCGGGVSSSGDSIEITVNTGTFVDSPVEGLKYETVTLSGFTDNQGRFQYKDGEIVTFKIGNLELGSAAGEELMTPLTLTGESNLNNISSKATNIARILQSLDENSSNTGLIKIPLSLKNLDISNIDLESDADLGTILSEAQTITSKSYTLKDSTTAKADMKKYITLFSQYKILKNDIYTGEGSSYFLLNMSRNGNIDITSNGNMRTDIYDVNMSHISYDYTGNRTLDSGQYIVKLTNNRTGGYTTIYSPVLEKEINFSSLENKTYEVIATKFYTLNITDSENIDITSDGNTRTDIYDVNMNHISYDYTGNRSLNTGKYIIKLTNIRSSGGYTTIYSKALENTISFNSLENKTYNVIGTKYYILHLNNNTNIDITSDGNTRTDIYDIDMNHISYDYTGIRNLNAGQYIIKITNNRTNGGYTTIYSPELN